MRNFCSPLRYPGGKTSLAPELLKRIRKRFSSGEKITLIEPYAGGAGASLKLLLEGEVSEIFINDFDKTISSFWEVAVSDTDYLISKIQRTPITIEEWRKQKDIYIFMKNKIKEIYLSTNNKKKLAFATFFLNRTNRSGIISGGMIGGVKQSGRWKINCRFNKKTLIDRLKKIQDFRGKIKVFCEDGISFLKRLEKHPKANSYYLFLDPPYVNKANSLYLNYYQKENHEKLASFLETTSLKNWILTYDDNPLVKDLYSKMKRDSFFLNHSAYEARRGKELMISPR